MDAITMNVNTFTEEVDSVESDFIKIADATYSPEDNKLRLYCEYHLDDDEYKKVKSAGYKWAPKQELFVAYWSCLAEDIALEFSGEIEPEDKTMLERAEEKATRLENIASNRERDFNSFMSTANSISERFAFGQPILIGHHSQRRAEKDRDRMSSAMDNAVKSQKAASYWLQRASGCEHHANRKNNDGVRARRIKTLLSDLRKQQRYITDAQKFLERWELIAAVEDETKRNEHIETLSGYSASGTVSACYWGAWSDLDKGKITHAEVLEKGISGMKAVINGVNRARVMVHLLNRIGYERSFLAYPKVPVSEMKETMIQIFCREQGADKPKATKVSIMGVTEIEEAYKVVSTVSLPIHISDGKELTLSTEAWIDLMQDCGFIPPVRNTSNRPAKPPLLNINKNKFLGKRFSHHNKLTTFERKVLTKAELKRIHNDYKGTLVSECGLFRFRIAFCKDEVKAARGVFGDHSWYYIFLKDSKKHDKPKAD